MQGARRNVARRQVHLRRRLDRGRGEKHGGAADAAPAGAQSREAPRRHSLAGRSRAEEKEQRGRCAERRFAAYVTDAGGAATAVSTAASACAGLRGEVATTTALRSPALSGSRQAEGQGCAHYGRRLRYWPGGRRPVRA